ncbi:apolipophorin-III precursor (apoLp-III) domain-containing protein [Phthorimaea operculella]|nr:apolipophorin-III precursor (apoLp-III) domain-containing protein [Phthorimaea operculella]
MYKFAVLFACVALAHGMVRREAPAPSGQNLLEDIQKRAEEFGKTFSEQVNSIVNSKNTQEVNNALKKGSDDVLQQLSALSNSLQGALSDANGKAKEALEQTRANIEKTVAELRKAHPEVEQQTNELKEKLQNAVKATNEQAQKLAKEVAANMEATNEKLAPKLKQVPKLQYHHHSLMLTSVTDDNEQSQKLAKEVAANMEATNEKLAPKLKQAFEDFQKQAEAVQKQIHEAATKQ